MHGVSTNQNVYIDLENDLMLWTRRMNATYERIVETPCMASLRIKNVCIDLENDLMLWTRRMNVL